MNLLVCGYCKDVRKLGFEPDDSSFWTVCKCGKSRRSLEGAAAGSVEARPC
jgi:hypothetical protein